MDSFDVTRYMPGKCLDGLSHVLAEHRRSRSRTNPVARTTELLKEVFGR